MIRLTTLFDSWGNAGAVANAHVLIETLQREEWVIDSLVRRLDPVPAVRPAAAAPSTPARVA